MILKESTVWQNAQLDATIFDATRAYGIKQFGLDLDNYAANTSAYNNISTSAYVAPSASFMTIKPIEQKAPPKTITTWPNTWRYKYCIKYWINSWW